MNINKLFYLRNLPLDKVESERDRYTQLLVYSVQTEEVYEILLGFLCTKDIVQSINIYISSSEYMFDKERMIFYNAEYFNKTCTPGYKPKVLDINDIKLNLNTLKILKQILVNICGTNVHLSILGKVPNAQSSLNALIERWGYTFKLYRHLNNRLIVVRKDIYIFEL